MPSGALSSPINTDSVSSCRTMRQRPAPSAARTAISRWRAVARASSRLATFEQAISSTSVAAPIIVRITSFTSSGSIQVLRSRDRDAPVGILGRDMKRPGLWRGPAGPSSACCIVMPGFRRAKTCTPRWSRGAVRGRRRSGPTGCEFSGNMNFGGITPMTVCGRPLILMARPITPRVLLVTALPDVVPSSTTGSAPGLSSSAAKLRPWIGGVPSR